MFGVADTGFCTIGETTGGAEAFEITGRAVADATEGFDGADVEGVDTVLIGA